MKMFRLFPPEGGATLAAHGRSYTCAANAMIDVPDFDAIVLMANGWTSAAHTAGATNARPTAPGRGESYYDETLGMTIFCTGFGPSAAPIWRRPDTGAIC